VGATFLEQIWDVILEWFFGLESENIVQVVLGLNYYYGP
jgi:hypothetical protein